MSSFLSIGEGGLDTLQSQWPARNRLVEAWEKYQALNKVEWEEFFLEHGEVVMPGGSHPLNPAICRRLVLLEDLAENALCGETGTPSLTEGVRRFQRRHGLVADGIVGRRTLADLNVTPEERARRIGVNLERWHRLPREAPSNRIEVNIPGFELQVHEQGGVPLKMKVVVGREAWETKSFDDTLTHLVFNPYWYVPPSIFFARILPAIRSVDTGKGIAPQTSSDSLKRKAIDYLSGHRYELIEKHSGEAKIVDPGEVDWSRVREDDFPYTVRQKPGPGNAMGRVKFLFPNEHAIYLHDTPVQRHFEMEERIASHGCIRIEKPLELAEWLLEPQGWTRMRIEDVLATGENRRENLERGIPIFITYFTVWVDSDGAIQFRKDIYGWDENLLSGFSPAQEANGTGPRF